MVFQNMLHATFYNIKDYRKKRCFNVFGHKKAISAEQDKNKKAFNLKTISKNNKMRAKEWAFELFEISGWNVRLEKKTI